MKAELEVRKAAEAVSPLDSVVSGKVQKKKHSSKKSRSSVNKVEDDKEKSEIKAYLNKLQEIVPFMPKDRKLSKTEVILKVIEYIRELRLTLGLPPCSGDEADFEDFMEQPSSPALMMSMALMSSRNSSSDVIASSVPASVNASISSAKMTSPASATVTSLQQSRQPLGVISNPENCTNGAPLSTQVLHKAGVIS